jgi:glycosyltransferase involved in cell wall biosynthesis
MSISVAIAVHNEQENLPKFLENIYGFADEIVVVDGESTDNSVKILEKYDKDKKIKIIHTSNPPMFHINKQKALDECTKEWILQLDADEIIPENLKNEILTEIKNPKFVAYWMPRLNYFLGSPLTKGGQYPDYTLRFYKNGATFYPCKNVHEQVEIRKMENENGKEIVGYFKNPMHHFPYKDFQAYMDKWHRYNQKEADRIKEKGFRPNFINGIDYLFVKPIHWFLLTYFRHLGIVDGWAGFVFSFMSSVRFIGIYVRISR